MLKKRTKTKIVKEHQVHDKDTGSAQVQIAVRTKQIDELAKHLKKNPKDNHSRRGLLKMVIKRKKLLKYLEKTDKKRYNSIIKKVGLKK